MLSTEWLSYVLGSKRHHLREFGSLLCMTMMLHVLLSKPYHFHEMPQTTEDVPVEEQEPEQEQAEAEPVEEATEAEAEDAIEVSWKND